MYIPLSFFSSQGSCFTVTTSTISGSGIVTSGSFISGGFYWDYYKFETLDYTSTSYPAFTASFNVLSGSTGQAKLLIVAGGGTGGGRQQTFTEPGADRDWTTDYSGGGGGGGIVYYDQFPISSGSYQIGVGGATAGTNGPSGSQGKSSYIRLTNSASYTPFTSNFLLAEGGGAGGSLGYDRTAGQTTYRSLGPGSGGSAGGAGSALDGLAQGGQGTPNPNGGLYQPQGFRGGLASGVSPSTGGGGAGGPGADSNPSGNTRTDGGIGALYNITGTPTYYAGGGGGAGRTNGLGDYGQGGKAVTSIGGTSENSKGGVVIIAIPKCSTAFSCRQFAITGSGAVASFLECGNSATSSTTLASGYDIVACLKTLSGSITPVVATGATFVALSASCDTPFTSSNDGCTNCNTYAVTSDSNKIAKVTYTPCNSSTSSITYVAGTYNLCVSGSAISVATGSASSLGTACSVLSCDATPSNDNTPTCPCQSLFVNVFSGIYRFDYTDCNGVTQTRTSGATPFCGVPGSIRNGSCIAGSCIGLNIRQGGSCCTYP